MDPITLYIIRALIGVAISAGVSLIQQALAPKPEATKAATRGFRGQFSFGGTVPLKIVLGTYGVPGHLEYRNTFGNSGGTPNSQVTDVLSLSDYLITDVTASWVDTQSVTLPDTNLSSIGYPIPEYEDGGKNHLWYFFHDGSQTTVDSFLTSKFGSDAVRPWESDMVGEGIAQAIMSARVNDKLWSGFPSYMFQLQGAPVFDPRESTAAGGSGSQVWGTLSTYEFSDNPVVLIYNILRGIYDGDDNHIWGGRATAYQLPYADWEAAMDRCDTSVNKKGGGTEKRYRAGIEIGVNERPTDIIRELLIGCNGRIAYHQGQYFPLIDVPSSADGSFSDSDMLADQPHTASLFPDLDSIVNGAAATYVEPQRAWENKETAPYYRADLEAEDDDRRLLESLTLRTVFSGTQAQRILKAVVEESRRFKRHIVALPPGFGVYRPLQVLAWTSDEFQYDEKLFLITSKTEDEWGNILLALQELDPADFDWDEETDEQDISFAPITPIRAPAQPMTGWTAIPAYLENPDGAGWLPSIEVGWASNQDDVTRVRIQVRETWDANRLIFDGSVEYDIADATPSKTINASFLPAEDYEARGIYVSTRPDRDMDWSDWIGVTTPNVSPLPPNSIFIETLTEELQNIVGIVINPALGGSIPSQLNALRQKADALAAALMDVSATAKERLDLLDVSREGAAAAVIRNEIAIVTETEARAAAITEVIASFGESFADGFLAFDALVNEEEATATITAKVRAEQDGELAQAAWIIKASVDGGDPESLFGIFADRFALVNDINDTAVSPFYTDVDGNVYINSAIIANASISSAMIGTAAITSLKIGTNAVTTGKIADGALTRSKFALKVVGGAQIDDLAVGLAQIGNNAINSSKIAAGGLSDRTNFALKVIGGAQIDDLAVGSAQIASAAITNAKIGSLAVDRIKIADGAVTDYTSVAGDTTPDRETAADGTVIADTVVDVSNLGVTIAAHYNMTASGVNSGFDVIVRLQIRISGTWYDIASETWESTGGSAGHRFMLNGACIPGATGSYQVRFTIRNTHNASSTHTGNYARLTAWWPKK